MRGTFNRAFAVSLLVVFAVCGGKKSPTSPTPNPSPTPSSVAVTSPNAAILVGQTEQMTAIVTLSDGTTRAGTGTWGSDTPSVATVSQSGLATGLAAGEATIYFDATGDGRGSKRLRVDLSTISARVCIHQAVARNPSARGASSSTALATAGRASSNASRSAGPDTAR